MTAILLDPGSPVLVYFQTALETLTCQMDGVSDLSVTGVLPSSKPRLLILPPAIPIKFRWCTGEPDFSSLWVAGCCTAYHYFDYPAHKAVRRSRNSMSISRIWRWRASLARSIQMRKHTQSMELKFEMESSVNLHSSFRICVAPLQKTTAARVERLVRRPCRGFWQLSTPEVLPTDNSWPPRKKLSGAALC